MSDQRTCKIWSCAPKGGPTPRQTGRLTVGRIFNSTPRVTSLERPSSTCTSKLQTRPLVREGTTQEENRTCWSRVPEGGLIPGETGRMTVGPKLALTLDADLLVRERLAECY
jgi:hypothetical protein